MSEDFNLQRHQAEPQQVPLEGELDLHTFRPEEAAAAVEAFVEESRARGWRAVRIVHGKGTGALRERVHAVLRRLPHVAGFRQGDERSGGWGATIATLKMECGR